ncbi:cupin domain-containing protein (plasmid) [Paraburkholderia sprentiae WSM5005]|uniref:Cupin domain-containing protein n=1 Tax=Paraburkholderia sprentiae WSM5005 TaxID=754502 RepID=A0A1I9YWH0_9BURK|nr:cupin domain-containing protein [Paraburkholderia sprentiae]APA90550.1 cupin domain-containing protein [Paraburkholderia sprentiae WSM5005]
MRYVRPFLIDGLSAGPASEWLLGPEDGVGCTVRLHRGGVSRAVYSRDDVEQFALLLAGSAFLHAHGESQNLSIGELAFIPAGISGSVSGDGGAVWAEIETVVPSGFSRAAMPASSARVIPIDQSRFEGGGFAYQSLIDRKQGAQTMRMNVLQVQPGAGSPDFHIHAFTQIYLIQEGEMTLDIGKQRVAAPVNSLVFLPAGVVHRNFNAGNTIERHVSLLVPEPDDGQIFDFAVTIHDREAELLQQLPN